MDAKLKTGQWRDGEEKIMELFVLAQLDIWNSIETALALSDAVPPAMDRHKLVEYVKEEQAVYADFAQPGVKVLIYQDREMGKGGMEAVTAVCAAIERAIQLRIEELGQLVAPAGNSAEELAQLRQCKQLCSSVLQLYHEAAAIKSLFDEVRRFFGLFNKCLK